MAFLVADRLKRPVDEMLDLPLHRMRQWLAYCKWVEKEKK